VIKQTDSSSDSIGVPLSASNSHFD